jgi:hypothetical protein
MATATSSQRCPAVVRSTRAGRLLDLPSAEAILSQRTWTDRDEVSYLGQETLQVVRIVARDVIPEMGPRTHGDPLMVPR